VELIGLYLVAAGLLVVAGVGKAARPNDTARALARRIARHSPHATRIGKRALNQIEWTDLKSGYEAEQGYTTDMAGHPDAQEAIAAFTEKRPPSYAPADG